MKVNLSTSEKTFVCFAEDGAPDTGDTTTGVCSEDGDRRCLSFPLLLTPVEAPVNTLKKLSFVIDEGDTELAAPEAFSFCFAADGEFPYGPAEPTPNRAPGRLTLAGWKVTRGL